ncbi:MAG: hypothetical protein GXN98_02355 [Euryarchaeota archaeon]|nr:hypothetical protein [Euryarchaeota archaeon]
MRWKMLNKTGVALGLGIAVLFAGVVYTLTSSTARLIDTQAELLKARVHGELGGEEYAELSQEAERSYRQSVAEALGGIVEKIEEVAVIVDRLMPESNASSNVSELARNLSIAVQDFSAEG